MKILNNILGAIVKFILFAPLIALQTALIPFLFIDKLIAGKYLDALKTLLFSPFKMLQTFFIMTFYSMQFGWRDGLIQSITPSFKKVKDLFTDTWGTKPNYFYAAMMPSFINMFEGAFIGSLLRKLTLVFIPAKIFEIYRHYDDSPHAPKKTMALNDIYKDLMEKHAADVEKNQEKICAEISSFLNTRSETGSDEEKFMAAAAIRCLERLTEDRTSLLHKRAGDLSEETPKNTLYALCLIWRAIPASSRELLASYLGQIQRGQIDNYIDLEAPDYPECPTGTMATLALALPQSASTAETTITLEPTITDSWPILKKNLCEKLQQTYNSQENMKKNAAEFINTTKDNAKFNPTHHAAHMKYFARFLNDTRQGRAATGLPQLDRAGVDALVEAVIDAWEPPIKQ